MGFLGNVFSLRGLVLVFVGYFWGYTVGAWHKSVKHVLHVDQAPSKKTQPLDNNTQKKVVLSHDCKPKSTTTFDKIYKKSFWNRQYGGTPRIDVFYNEASDTLKTRYPGSGGGSALGRATMTSMKILNRTIYEYGVKSMIDVPCGDVNWIFDSWSTDGSLELYLGLDIVEEVTDFNNVRFAHHSNKHFQHWDGSACPVPKYKLPHDGGGFRSFDLVHARDVIQHIPLQEGLQFMCHVLTSGAKVLVTTTYMEGKNEDIEAGKTYQNNLMAEPFGLPNVTDCEYTHPPRDPDHTCVFNLTEPWVQEFVSKKCA